MDINLIVEALLEHVKDDAARGEIYTRLLADMDEYDLEDAEIGVDPVFDAIYEEHVSTDSDDEEEEFEEDDDYEAESDEEWTEETSSDE